MNKPSKYASETDEQHRRRIKNRYPVSIEPTFPLDNRQVRDVKEVLVLGTPKFLVWQLLAQLGSRFSLLSRFSESWAEIEPQLSEAVVEHVIKQSNVAQNQVLQCVIQTLEANHCGLHAETMRSFLWLKQSIEGSLRRNRQMATLRAEIETLSDAIIQEVCYEILILADLETKLTRRRLTGNVDEPVDELKSRIDACQERIERAHKTLQETELQARLPEPVQETMPAIAEESQDEFESKVLDKLIDTLREENDLAKAINDRIEEELPTERELARP